MKILVTGANGFVGKSLSAELFGQGHTVQAAVRTKVAPIENVETTIVGEVNGSTDWSQSLAGVSTVVHLAARVHIMRDSAADPLAEFRAVNVHGTLNLARQAAAAGVRRFVFLSSIGVNGAVTELGKPFTTDDKPAPHSFYAISKHEAEMGLRDIAAETGMQVVIIRPPLIYGANAPGNFGSLLRVLSRGVPLPLGLATHNRRSFVALDNLVNFIITCVHHPNAANQTFLVSYNEDVSTADLLRRMAVALGVPSRLIPVPLCVLNLSAKLLGKADVAQRLLGNLQVDITKNKTLLGWQPPLGVDEGLRLAI